LSDCSVERAAVEAAIEAMASVGLRAVEEMADDGGGEGVREGVVILADMVFRP